MKVRAKKLIYIYNRRMQPGTEFTLVPVEGIGANGEKIVLSPEKQFSKDSMERLDGDASEKKIPHRKGLGKGAHSQSEDESA